MLLFTNQCFNSEFQGISLPNIEASTETLASLAIEQSAQSAFLPSKTDISLWKRAWYSCKENGMSGMLEEMAEGHQDGESQFSPGIDVARETRDWESDPGSGVVGSMRWW